MTEETKSELLRHIQELHSMHSVTKIFLSKEQIDAFAPILAQIKQDAELSEFYERSRQMVQSSIEQLKLVGGEAIKLKLQAGLSRKRLTYAVMVLIFALCCLEVGVVATIEDSKIQGVVASIGGVINILVGVFGTMISTHFTNVKSDQNEDE